MDIQDRIADIKRRQFLRYIVEQSHRRTGAMVQVGTAGEALGLPYGEAIRIADDLREAGLVSRVGRLNPPDGPGVVLTDAGLEAAEADAA
jgi:hypothetical protein